MGTLYRPSRAAVACLVAVAVIASSGEVGTRQADAALADLLSRAGAYVSALEHTFVTVICDETYEQHVDRQGFVVNPRDPPPPTQPMAATDRRMRSEMLFMWVLEQQTWLSVRNVLEVDGEPVPDSQERLTRALRGDARTGMPRLRQMLQESARFNIGPVPRNIGDPTLALQFLAPDYQPRFAFTIAGRQSIDGVDVLRLTFAERARPTVITDDGADVVSNGFVWVRPSDGAVVRTNLRLTITKPTPLKASITVDFTRDAKLNMMVPSRMEESYELTYPEQDWPTKHAMSESIRCVARYANFRRFETSGRIIVPNN